jgi:low affinity Fe/Cu permease
MVFMIQNTQYRDSAAIQLKLDEIIRSINGAHMPCWIWKNSAADDLERIRGLYEKLAEQARRNKQGGWRDMDTPEITPA